MDIAEFILARVAEDEDAARGLLRDLEGQIAEEWAGAVLTGVTSQWRTATLSFNGTFSAGKDFSAATTF